MGISYWEVKYHLINSELTSPFSTPPSLTRTYTGTTKVNQRSRTLLSLDQHISVLSWQQVRERNAAEMISAAEAEPHEDGEHHLAPAEWWNVGQLLH